MNISGVNRVPFVLMFLSCLSLSSFAINAYAEGPGWTGWSTVESVVVVHNGGVNVHLEPSLTSCTSQSGYGATWASVYPDHPGIDRIYSALLAASTTGKPIRLYLSDSTCRVSEMIFDNY